MTMINGHEHVWNYVVPHVSREGRVGGVHDVQSSSGLISVESNAVTCSRHKYCIGRLGVSRQVVVVGDGARVDVSDVVDAICKDE